MITLLSSNTNTVSDLPFVLAHPRGYPTIRVQVDYPPGTTGSIELFARIDPTLHYVSLGTYAANAVIALDHCEFFRAALTGVSGGGVVTVGIQV